jgi:adenine-specific DNA glycosylase
LRLESYRANCLYPGMAENKAEAPLAEAIRVWGDLGRYRRVVNLHKTARILVEDCDGEIPSDPKVW